MEYYPINLIYFVIVFPIVIVGFAIISKIHKTGKLLEKIVSLSLLLFLIRFILIFFQETIGIMPYLVEDVVFYTILMIFGIIFTFFYIYKIEKLSLEDIGGKTDNIKRSILLGLLGFIPLIPLLPIIMFLTNIQISINITLGKLIVALSFTILGAIYEELLFRGVIQNHFNELTNHNNGKVILLTAFTFTITHIFYLPFIGFGIFYIFVFIMAVILSILRIKADLLASAILHGGIVFILIILV